MSFNQNQFKKQVVVGQIDLSRSGINNAFTFRIDPDSSTTGLVGGEGVKLVDGGANDFNGVPLVDVLGADTELATGGVIITVPKQGTFLKGEIVQCAQVGDVVWMEAIGALARGVEVSLDVSAPGVVQALGVNAKIGITLDKATSAGDLIRVRIETAVAST